MISDAIGQILNKGAKAYVPYICAGDPDLESTRRFVHVLAETGATAIELGVPFSDPVGDGVTNQRAAERALRNGTSLRDVLELISTIRGDGVTTPIIIFTYANPIVRMGVKSFAAEAAASGVDGVLVVDLPVEEADQLTVSLKAHMLQSIFLIAPTTSDSRLRAIGEASSGFVYVVARAGVTGVRDTVSTMLPSHLARLRAATTRPLVVGFGVANADQAAAVAKNADGVVVGSALVECIASAPTPRNATDRLRSLSQSIAAVLGAR